MTSWIRWFDEVGMDDLPAVGGKNASLGEMRRALTPLGIRTPDGFATTAEAYRAFLRAAGLERVIEEGLRHLEVDQIDRLQAAGGRIRSAILAAQLPDALIHAVSDAYRMFGVRVPFDTHPPGTGNHRTRMTRRRWPPTPDV